LYYPVGNNFKLAWDVRIFVLDGKHWWNVKIDATSGPYIDKFGYTVTCTFEDDDHANHDHGHSNHASQYFNTKTVDVCDEQEALEAAALATQKSYRVLRYSVESPNHGPFTLEVNPENLTASPLGWHSQGNTPDSYQETRGNNVRAIDDSTGGQNNGPETLESSSDVYDYAYGGPYVAASTYIDAAVTNLFYMCNAVHDIYYLYGFDEASGNFQNSNFGNGGLGNDAIRADAQDNGGVNNANFSSPPDGTSGAMQMYLWNIAPVSNLLTVNNSSVSGDYAALDNNFDPGNVTVTSSITADLVLADDNTGDVTDACENVQNGAQMSGKIGVVRRGSCEFQLKVQNCQNRGAVAVLVVNNVAGDIAMGGANAGLTIPAYSINQAEGEAIISAMSNGTVNATFNAAPAGFQNIDGDFDNGIIAHEYGHGINIRLVSGPANSNCATGYGEGLSEGWADYIGKIMFLDNIDNGIFVSGTGTFAIGEPINGAGIRPAPYSGDISNNDMTFQDMLANNGRYSVPHGVGSAFAGVLWDLTWDLIAIHGFEPDIYNSSSSAGNVLALQLLMDSLKLVGCRPTINDSRDSIIQADQNLTGGANFCSIWSAFARRGWGLSSNSGGNGSAFDGSAANDLPGSCSPDYIMTIGGPTDSCEGTSLNFDMVFNAQNGWSTNVGFAVSGLPSGASATFSPTTISDTGLVTLIVTNLPAGVHNLTVTPGGDASKNLVLPINVQESNADLTDGDTTYQIDTGGYISFSDGDTINVSDGSNLDLQLPDTAFVGTLLWTAPNGTQYTTNTVNFSGVAAGDTTVEGNWTVVPTFTLDCPGSTGDQTINFTVAISATICFSPKVFLQGALLTSGGALMDDSLRTSGNIPLTSPYPDAVTAPASVFNVTGNNAIVDWVWLEVREVGNATNVLESRSALVQRDGDVVSYIDGTGTIKFGLTSGNYSLSINHRNHLGVMSSTLALDSSCKVIDFSNGSLTTFGSNAQTIFGVPSGVTALWAGDVLGNSQIKFIGALNDGDSIKDEVLLAPGNIFNDITYEYLGYFVDDVSMNSTAKFSGSSNDVDLIKDNVLFHPGNIFNDPTYIIVEQLP
jgi:hypothetical protein